MLDFISLLEKELGIKAIKEFKEMQLGDVQKTFADIESIKSNINIKPKTSLEEGLKKFVNWYKEFYINWFINKKAYIIFSNCLKVVLSNQIVFSYYVIWNQIFFMCDKDKIWKKLQIKKKHS